MSLNLMAIEDNFGQFSGTLRNLSHAPQGYEFLSKAQ